MEMVAHMSLIAISVVGVTSAIIIAVHIVNWVWWKPKKLEKYLREQGFDANSYRFLRGDMLDYAAMAKNTKSKQIKLSDNVSHHALPYVYHTIKKYGKKSFAWFGPVPNLIIVDPELIREMLSKNYVFHKLHPNSLGDMLLGGLLTAEEHKWAKHRKIITPAFHIEKLKKMLPAMHMSCVEMISKWETLVSKTGSAEVDVWPYLEDWAGDVISRTAFGSNYEEGRKIFLLQKELTDLTLQLMQLVFIPGWRYFPTKASKRINEVCKQLQTLLRGIVSKRQIAMEMGEVRNDDLLGILLDSNIKEIKEDGIGMSIEDVMKECKLFYFAGSETTSNLLVWTLVLLSAHSEWQARAREEILQAFGTKTPDFDGLGHLKIVTMILQEVLRLYPPASMINRSIPKDAELGNIKLPAGLHFTVPIILLHYDTEIWGMDAHEFKPERFSEGIFSATKNKYGYIPFGGGPRACIGQNFAMVEAKMALTMILQRFTFELSPSYTHAPLSIITLQPQYATPIILHKL